MAAIRRCTICAYSLPDDSKWAKCPACGEPTDRVANEDTNITDEEATKVLRHREFEEYLEKERTK